MKSQVQMLLIAVLLSTGCSTEAQAPVVRSDILLEPEEGSYLTDYWQQPTDIMLTDAGVSIRSCGRDYGTRFMYPGVDLEAGDACLVVAGRVENHGEEKLEIAMFARGYDENGTWVAETLDGDGVYGSIMFDMEPGQTHEFLLHLNPSDRVRTIRVSGGPYKDRPTGLMTPIPDEPFPPGTPSSESAVIRIIFSRKWLLENDQDPEEDWVKITFPESWLLEPPRVPGGEVPVEFAVPAGLLMDHNMSNNPDEITVLFEARFFIGL